MREIFEYAGKTVRVKPGVGLNKFGQNMSGRDFEIEGWYENVAGTSWVCADGNPEALWYAIRIRFNGANNNVPAFSNDVVYGKIGAFGHLFHVNELEF